jgi:hypothetical protein
MPKRPFKQTQNDTSSVRNHPCILATCDAMRGREASKELVNLLNEVQNCYFI